jgi:hypothetical protein
MKKPFTLLMSAAYYERRKPIRSNASVEAFWLYWKADELGAESERR